MNPDDFLTLSAELTGFSEFDLLGTGQAESYLRTVISVAGEPLLSDLLRAYRDNVTEIDDEQKRAGQMDLAILGDERFGPLARRIIKLWYAGVWFGDPAAEGTFTPSAQSYSEALLWVAIGANPPGARAPGYGSWADPPRIPAVPSSSVPRSLSTL